jgi:hypothetical protein
MRKLIFVFVTFCATTSVQAAELTVRGFINYHDASEDGRHMSEIMIGSAGSAFGWANSRLDFENRAQLYCEPKSLRLTNSQYFDIFRQYAEGSSGAMSEHSNMKEYFLLMGLKSTFPCSTE